MIESNVYELIEQYSKILRLDLTPEEFARLVADKNCSEESIQTTCELFHYLAEKKQATTVHTLLKMSRLPLKNSKTFENFDFSVIKGRDVERLKNVSSLSAVYAHRNLAFIIWLLLVLRGQEKRTWLKHLAMNAVSRDLKPISLKLLSFVTN